MRACVSALHRVLHNELYRVAQSAILLSEASMYTVILSVSVSIVMTRVHCNCSLYQNRELQAISASRVLKLCQEN